jgi:5-oxoprolinase (ATP-hydrolysing)
MTASILSNGRLHGAFGLNGGKCGSTGENWIVRGNGREERVGHLAQIEMAAGDSFVISTPGGGGYGSIE